MSEENKNMTNDNEEPEKVISDGSESVTSSDRCDPSEHACEPADDLPSRKPKKLSLSTFICSAVALVLAAVMLTYTVCNSFYKKELADAKLNGAQNVTIETAGKYDALEILELIFDNYTFQELDDEKIMTAVMKAYVDATGDKHAEYFTQEEYDDFMDSIAGSSVGVGVSVINDFVTINSVEYNTIKIIQIFKDSPASNSELKVGDRVAWIVNGDEIESVSELGYTAALNKLRGEAGTKAEFKVIRQDENGEYSIKDISIVREKYEVESVEGKKIENTDIGYVKIDSFDITTPRQFTEVMDSLIESGCTRFVYDVRNNPGGEIRSIVAVMSFFLEKGKTVVTTETVNGYKQIYKVQEIDFTDTEYEPCTVTEVDIGKYAQYEKVVLCNENTASAAELLVSNFRDHKLGTVIGVTTYGKGVAQNTMPLSIFGIDGYLKYTSKIYYPPCGENYDGIGVTPDIESKLSDEALQYSLYELPIDKDDQLQKAIECLNK